MVMVVSKLRLDKHSQSQPQLRDVKSTSHNRRSDKERHSDSTKQSKDERPQESSPQELNENAINLSKDLPTYKKDHI